jgi:phosphomannomutase
MKVANSCGCTLIIANDPDADRLAAAEYDPVAQVWHVFTGNQIGVLLGHWCVTQYRKQNQPSAVLSSIVSSRMLYKIAMTEGISYFDTLTGFKWLGNKSNDLRSAGVDVLFSYEEALVA